MATRTLSLNSVLLYHVTKDDADAWILQDFDKANRYFSLILQFVKNWNTVTGGRTDYCCIQKWSVNVAK